MATIEVTADNFAEVGSSADTIVIGFSSAGCKPCATFASIFERVSERHGGIVFGAVDIETQSKLADAFGVSSAPTLMIVRDRVVLYARPGALPERVLDGLIGKVCDIDMDDVRGRLTTRRLPAVSDRMVAKGEGSGVEAGV